MKTFEIRTKHGKGGTWSAVNRVDAATKHEAVKSLDSQAVPVDRGLFIGGKTQSGLAAFYKVKQLDLGV